MTTLSHVLTGLLIGTTGLLIFGLVVGHLMGRYADVGPGDPPEINQ